MTGQAGDREAGSNTEPPLAKQAVFLERQSYRRRRLLDVARLIPLLGVLLLLVPLLWPESDPSAVASGLVPAMAMSQAITYVFAVWAFLIAGAILFGVGARIWGGDGRRSEQGHD